ncbi:hypothetical protein ACFSC6_06080 [Rufibacter sediminis]|uniref:Response regulatory domain-containing protein n=1 Tax=Rufibacter sediminis TaxID=2762756 RepID=A0ABR6VZ42_9BACT|nr:hypothetical protein [Rufibacter sediminis]MBC3542426.1 hypothetical protein [Rufibacter sediminis]
MNTSYKLLLLEDDHLLAGSLAQALNKQNQYAQRVDIQALSYEVFENQYGLGRNSTREFIVLGGKASLGYAPDTRLLKSLATQLERTHLFVLTSSLDGKEILNLWQPGVGGVLQRDEHAHVGLVKAILRLQLVQQKRTYVQAKPKPTGIWQKLFA